MAEYRAKRHASIKPLHPGELLREDVIPALGKPKSEIARLLGISRQALYDILNEKGPVTAEMAVKMGKLCGNGPALWLNLQRAYDLWHAQREVDVSRIPTLQAAE
ncbi:MAG: antitoxin HigA [Hyphomicrobiales bacterium]|jgi:addiction module HigA family antidote|nr:antitoxin HigA [Hyphomicrobiales bacterium]